MSTMAATVAELADRVNCNAGLVRRGRFVDLEFMLQIGDQAHYLCISNGQLTAITPGPMLMRPWRFAVHIQAEAWFQFCQTVPRPGYHDLFAMCKLGVARIEGDLHPLMANLRYFQELLATARPKPTEADHGG